MRPPFPDRRFSRLQSATESETLCAADCDFAIDRRRGKFTGRRCRWQRTIVRTRLTRRIRSTRHGPSRPVDRFRHPGLTAVGRLKGLLPCWWAAAELRPWWAQEVANMAVAYPSFGPLVRHRHRDFARLIASARARTSNGEGMAGPETVRERVEREECGGLVITWRGVITPFLAGMPFGETQAIVADLDEDRQVRVMADGVLAHYEGCGGRHQPRPQFRLGRALHESFRIEIAYRRPPGCPIARSIWPRIDRHHPSGPPPHLLNTIDAVCVVFSADR